MHIKSIVAAAAIALIAGVGSVSADELSVADPTVAQDTPFALLDGIATEQMSVQESAATRGAGGALDIEPFFLALGDPATHEGPGGEGTYRLAFYFNPVVY